MHTDYGSALTIAAKYQPLAVKFLLEYSLPWEILACLGDLSMNYLEIGCMYNADSVKYAIESNVDLTALLYKKYNDEGTPLMIAAKYQPEAVKYILESKYITPELLNIHKDDACCLDMAYEFQPKSLKYILKSKNVTDVFVDHENSIGYRLKNELHKNYPIFDVNNVKDLREKISMIPLTKYNNKFVKDDNPLKCTICLTFKKQIFFIPCGHMACVGCSFKLKNCPYCNKEIKERKIIFE